MTDPQPPFFASPGPEHQEPPANTEPAESLHPAQPRHPAQPTQSAQSDSLAAPSQSAQPAQPTQSAQPLYPAPPTWPIAGSYPGYPGPGGQQPRVRPRKRARLGAGSVLLIVALALAAGGAGGFVAGLSVTERPPSVVEVPVVSGETASERPAGSVAGIARSVTPSVVSLEVAGESSMSTGSGFVLSEDGYILTNNHVVASAGEGRITVLLADGSKEPAKLIGSTGNYDLAVVKIDRAGLEPLVLGDSDAVVVGDPVIAIGAPLGLDGTVTTGIVSAMNRPVVAGGDSETAFINAIQTDAAINPGNSGGPLVNAEGEVIGINSAIAQPPGSDQATGSIGLGFSIPSNQAKRTASELIETGTATYPMIGVLLDQWYDGEGVMVLRDAPAGETAVTPDGAADRAGIKSGDVILAIDGRPVTEPNELIVAIRAKAPGDAVVLTIRSVGSEQEAEVRMVLDEAVSQ